MKASIIPSVCLELQRLQRYRNSNLKSRIMLENRLVSTIAVYQGYHSGLDPEERKVQFDEARKLVRDLIAGTVKVTCLSAGTALMPLIEASRAASGGFDAMVTSLEKEMVVLAKELPIAEWVAKPTQKGFGSKSLAIIIGEAGDLANYANPGKLWSRMGCAPYESKGKMLMGSTWRSGREGKLTSEEWEDFGYSPRRRSVMYVIGECLVKQNDSIYRRRYDSAKQLAGERHPEWTKCKCEGTGKSPKGKSCSHCSGKGKIMLRCHRHAMLLTSKLLLKNLWMEWNPDLVKNMVYG